jgi:Fibronectin type III domain
VPKSLAMAALGVLVVGALAPAVAFASTPSGPIGKAPGYLVPVYAGTSPAGYRPAAGPSINLRRGSLSNSLVSSSTIRVTYHGFSAKAKAAFQAAVNVWQSIVVSDQVIHVDATWAPLGAASGILGEAGATNNYLEGDGYWYPGPLEEARCHCNADTGTEIQAEFNSQFMDWYYRTDGLTPIGKWDLETVVLHELGHGLGFFSSLSVSGSYGFWGWQSGGVNHPLRFDANEWSAASAGVQLISFANGKAPLRSQLTDGSVFLGGSHVEAALGGRARLYAPNGWQSGSSNSHLDESTYAPRTVNALMTPILNDGEAIHAPGPAVTAIFQDIGWTVAGATSKPGAPQNVTATAGDDSALVSWGAPATDGGSNISSYKVTSSPGAMTCSTAGATSCTVGSLTNGVQYTFTVTATNGVGTGALSAPSNPVVPHAASSDMTPPAVGTPAVNIVAPQVIGSGAKVRVSWPAATDASGIAAYQLQRREGAGPWTTVGLTAPTSTSAQVSITRGSNYSFRVRATDGVGNVGSWTLTTSANMGTTEETSGSVVYSGSWTRSSVSGASGGFVNQSASTGDEATFTFTGTSVALVTTTAPDRGIVAVSLDGAAENMVDLYAPTKVAKSVVWAPDSALSSGTHTVVIRVTGTRDASSTKTRIDLDAFLVWP